MNYKPLRVTILFRDGTTKLYKNISRLTIGEDELFELIEVDSNENILDDINLADILEIYTENRNINQGTLITIKLDGTFTARIFRLGKE